MAAGPKATSTFLVLTALLFAVLLGVLAWQSKGAGGAAWELAVGLAVAAMAAIVGIVLARGVGEGRL